MAERRKRQQPKKTDTRKPARHMAGNRKKPLTKAEKEQQRLRDLEQIKPPVLDVRDALLAYTHISGKLRLRNISTLARLHEVVRLDLLLRRTQRLLLKLRRNVTAGNVIVK